MIKIAFFDTKEYDKKIFNQYNKDYGYDITYFETTLNAEKDLTQYVYLYMIK